MRPLIAGTRAPRAAVLFSTLHLCAAAFFVAAAGVVVSAPVERLLQIVPDDSFYYLQIARNIVRVGWPTADRLSATNGFHPLWMAFCCLLAWINPGDGVLLRNAVALSLAVHGLTAAVMSATLTPLVGRRWAHTAAVCWLLNPLAFFLASQAMEASVYACALVVLFAVHSRYFAGRTTPGATGSLLYGTALGLAFLARTEAAIIVICAVTYGAIGAIRRQRTLAGPLLVALGALAVVAPWLLYSLTQTGTIVQDSGAMKIVWARWLTPGWAGLLRNLIATITFLLERGPRLVLGWSIPAWWSAGGLLVLLAVTWRFQIWRDRTYVQPVLSLTVPTIAVWSIYAFTLTERQVWWLTLPALAAFLTLFLVIVALTKLGPAGGESWLQVTIVVVALVWFSSWQGHGVILYPWQPDVADSQTYFVRQVPPDARIGCFNAGIPLYYGHGRVIALDGIVSHEARLAWQARRFDWFVREKHIQFIADEQRAMNMAIRFNDSSLTLTPVASHPLAGWPSGRRILWSVR
jgi:hypothetical protein